MSEEYLITIDAEERERVLLRAESDPVFRDVARLCSDMVDGAGVPERDVERVFGDNRDLVILFRMYRMAAQVNNRLSGQSLEPRLTQREWEERRQELLSQKQALSRMAAKAQQNVSSLDYPVNYPTDVSVFPKTMWEKVFGDR